MVPLVSIPEELVMMLAALRLMSTDEDGAPSRVRARTIVERQIQHMARLVDDLLSLSRIELNEHIAPSGKVDLGRTIQDVTDAIRPLTEEINQLLAHSEEQAEEARRHAELSVHRGASALKIYYRLPFAGAKAVISIDFELLSTRNPARKNTKSATRPAPIKHPLNSEVMTAPCLEDR